MKKISLIMTIIVIASFVLAGCASDTSNREALKKLSVTYSASDDCILYSDEVDYSAAVQKFFAKEENKGFIAEILPIEYSFYYVVEIDEDFGKNLLKGYAECKCSIQKMSQKYNSLGDSDKVISIRQDIYLQPLNQTALTEMMESIGAMVDGQAVAGTYKVPNRYINEKDYKLLVGEYTIPLLGEEPYYAYVTFDGDIPYLSAVYNGSNEYESSIPNEIKTNMESFQKFLAADDSELLG